MTTGVVILLLALVGAGGLALRRRRVDGRFRGDAAAQVSAGSETSPDTPGSLLTTALPDERLGDRATLVQFSSAFCAPCRSTRVVLADVAGREHGVEHLEIDAEQHLELVRALDVRRTPTTLVLDGAGREVVRAAGASRRHQVLAALPVVSGG